jgi:D-glycero-alpha-D-manno-heptose-7-phosphate kinase
VVIVSRAPVRIADLGAWSDTWFAKSGAVSNVAMSPGVTVRLRPDSSLSVDKIRVRSLGDERVERIEAPNDWHDPLLGALVAHDGGRGGFEIAVDSGVPAGSGLGTSASVAVALVAALDTLHGRTSTQLGVAHRAHQGETATGRQSGVQDHAAAALGGVHRWAINYPTFSSHDRLTDDSLLRSLNRRLLAVYLGAPHESSRLHELVIRGLESPESPESPEWSDLSNVPRSERLLEPLRAAAIFGHDALSRGDFASYGQAMVACHEGQRRLHPELISDLADHVVSAVALSGAAGWKVNGAGGTGGSLTVLCNDDPANRQSLWNIINEIPGAEVLDLQVDHRGVHVDVVPD